MKKYLKVIALWIFISCFLLPIMVNAETGGDGNIDSGGGGMGSGSATNSWSSGNEAVRVTVVRSSDHAVVTTPIDITNKTPNAGMYHFGKVSKLQYNSGRSLSPIRGGYIFKNLGQTMPRIISSSSGQSNINAIKQYFCSEYVVKRIAEITGMNYDILISGQYKLLLEPLAFYKFEGNMFAATATETALYDEQTSGLVRRKLVSISHKNLPLAMFLEVSDLGYPAWGGSRTTPATNADIKSSLGIGIVRFTEKPEEPQIDAYDYEYRVDTDVITAVRVSGGQSDPDTTTRVSFTIEGKTYNVCNIYYPKGDSQLAWIKWRTPKTEQTMTIQVTVTGPGSTAKTTLNCNIVDFDKNPPPNPVADDRNDGFQVVSVPNRAEKSRADWSIWRPWWQEYWVWEEDWQWVSKSCDSTCLAGCSGGHGSMKDLGEWIDEGWYEFDLDRYSASLSTSMNIKCDEKNPTASGRTMKSGYGLRQNVSGSISTNQSSAVTQPQNAVSYFPEFCYETYWRLLENRGSGSFEFQRNNYSTYRNQTHFTPIWMPDGSYTVNTWLIDGWTPEGMLSANLTDSLSIRGSLWNDWHVAPKKPQ